MPRIQQVQAAPKAPLALQGADPPVISGWYIHTPFCFHKCHYCDFYSIAEGQPGSDSGEVSAAAVEARPTVRMEGFVDRLIAEIEWRSSQVRGRPETIFVGGGTPTWLPSTTWTRLLEALHRCVPMDAVREFTVEANPETVTPELMRTLAGGGVNRVSIGAQSFDLNMLKALERWHDPTRVGEAVDAARAAGIEHLNLDLIFAIPGQTMDLVAADLDAAITLAPDHISCYALTYEPNTPMAHRLGRGEFERADEELEHRMYVMVMDRLAGAGYEHYEVSNWARPGGRCRHNLLYWSNANWIGVGPSAASHISGRRWKNVPNLGRYIDAAPEPPTTDHEELPADQRVGETLMLGLRLREGVALAWLDEELSGDTRRLDQIDRFTRLGLMESTRTHLRLTERGLFVADTILSELL